MTENTGLAITDDYFLALQTDREIVLISMGIDGALELSDDIEARFDCRFGEKGNLCNKTDNDSVIFWPPEEAEQELYATLAKHYEPESLKLRYCVTYSKVPLGGCLGMIFRPRDPG